MRLARVVVFALLAAHTACMTGPRRVPDGMQYLEANAPAQMWATLTDGEQLLIDGPRVISDTVFGWAEGEEVAIPGDQFEEIRVRQLSVFRSALVPTAALGGSVGMFVLFRKDSSIEPPRDSSQDGGVELVRLPRP